MMARTQTQTRTGELLDAPPPSDVDAEQAVIGSVFLRPEVLDDVSLVLEARDFYDDRYRAVYALLLAMLTEGKRIDLKLFLAYAKKAGHQVDASLLAAAFEAVPTAANASFYAKLVRDEAIKRACLYAGTDIVRAALGDDDATEVLDRCESLVLEIRDQRGTLRSRATTVLEVLGDAMAEIDARMSGKRGGVATGFDDLDALAPLVPSELTILAARPSMGKTALALNIAANVASTAPVCFFSLEQNALAIGERMLCSQAEVDSYRIRNGLMGQAEREALVRASNEISRAKLVIDDSHEMSMRDIAAVCRREKRRGGLGLVVIDYLQLIAPENTRDSREQQVSRVSRRLKGLARELAVPVLCLAQLNRQTETTRDNRPRLSHLRESGSIEQDADVVAFVHRADYYAPTTEEKQKLKGQAELYIEKNRNGRTGVVELCWFEQIVTFRPRAWHADERNLWDEA